jgi:hypothetical protein
MGGLVEHFAELEDPRVERAKRHSLLAVITIALCGVICGAESWVEIEQFGHAKADWFATFLDLPQGIPSHDTFGRVFARLDAKQFEACFAEWMQAVAAALPAQVIALDGKTLRRSHDRTAGKAALHLVSAWARLGERQPAGAGAGGGGGQIQRDHRLSPALASVGAGGLHRDD